MRLITEQQALENATRTGEKLYMKRYLSTLFCFFVLAASSGAQDTTTEYAPSSPDAGPNRQGYEMILEAKLLEKGDSIESGLIWRVFDETEDKDGNLPLIATAKGGTASFVLAAGSYLVHGAFGRAGAIKRIILDSNGANETFVLNAGGLELTAEAGGRNIPQKNLRFSVFELEENEDGERKMIARSVAANKIIQLNEGTYHVLSRYGQINATVRADLEVKAGKVAKVVMQHRGASISLRLVSREGGDPIANTAWSVFTQDGERVFSSRSTAPSLILAEGTYEVVVQNGNKNLRQNFKVKPGINSQVEILLN